MLDAGAIERIIGQMPPPPHLALDSDPIRQLRQALDRAVGDFVAAGGDLDALLYRVDVDERHARLALASASAGEAGHAVAELIWQRSLPKIASRARHRQGAGPAGTRHA